MPTKIINKVKKLFKKKKKYPLPETFALVEFTKAAMKLHVGGDQQKRINVYKEGGVIRTEKYRRATIRSMMFNEGIPVRDMTDGSDHPHLDFHHITNPSILQTHKI